MNWCVELVAKRVDNANGPTLKEYLARMDQVRRPVRRHAPDVKRSYFNFIQESPHDSRKPKRVAQRKT